MPTTQQPLFQTPATGHGQSQVAGDWAHTDEEPWDQGPWAPGPENDDPQEISDYGASCEIGNGCREVANSPDQERPAQLYALDDDYSSELQDWEAQPELAPVPPGLLSALNKDQVEAVTTLDGPLLVVAGPGSGKTRVLTHRIAALLATGRARPWQVLAVTFTNKAAGEMRERVTALVGEGSDQMWVATFHSACLRILRANAGAAGLPKNFSIIDTGDAKRLISQVMADLSRGQTPDASDVRVAQHVISAAKNAGLDARGLQQSGTAKQWVPQVMEEYNKRLAAMGAVDFDDILLRCLSLLASDAKVLARYQRRFRYVLIDEFQDTNAVQLRIVQLLSEAHNNICVVGDADQAIYGFRGAESGTVDAFSQMYPSAKVVVLEQNYRSTQAVLDVVRAIIGPNKALHRPKLYTDNPKGAPVRLYIAEDDRQEAAWVVADVLASRANYADSAVLMRTNAQSRSFEEELVRRQVPYSVVGALRFYDRAEVRTALAYLRVALNPADAISFERAVNTPRRGLGDTTVTKILVAAATAGTSPIAAAREIVSSKEGLPNRAIEALARFLEVYDQLTEACSQGPAAALEVVAGPAGMRKMLQESRDGLDRAENLDELIAGARRFVNGQDMVRPDRSSIADLPGLDQTAAYLENVALVSTADEDGDEEDHGRLLLLTAHASKGKEFKNVYVVGVEDGLFPHTRTKDNQREIEEERRLLFVACSRAELKLTITLARQRMTYGKLSEQEPSPFLSSLPEDVVDVSYAGAYQRPYGSRRSGAYGAGPTSWSAQPGSLDRSRSGARPAPAGARQARPGPQAGQHSGEVHQPSVKPRVEADQLHPGTRVEHSIFGPGRVVSVQGTRVEVAFTSGIKLLDTTLAPLALAG